MYFFFHTANVHNCYCRRCWLLMAKMFPRVNLPVTPARRWGNPQTAHLLDPDRAFDAGSRACLHGSLVSALCWVLIKGTPWHYSHIFPAIFLTFSSFQTSFPQGNSPGYRTLFFISRFLWTPHSLLLFRGSQLPQPCLFSLAFSPSSSGTCGYLERSAILPSHLAYQEGAPWSLQLIASSCCLLWALISGPSTLLSSGLKSIPLSPGCIFTTHLFFQLDLPVKPETHVNN